MSPSCGWRRLTVWTPRLIGEWMRFKRGARDDHDPSGRLALAKASEGLPSDFEIEARRVCSTPRSPRR
jgi:hypothetical protein